MKAICVQNFGDPQVLQLQDVDDLVPQAGQVLVRVHAAGVNPFETSVRAGQYAALPDLPYTPGCDGAGVVEAVGAEVAHVKAGDRVYLASSANGTSGTYAEQVVAPAEHVHALPDGVSFQQGAALGVPYGTAYRALFQRAQAQPGEWLLVHGATGGVGLAAVQLARAAGLRVIGTGGTQAGRDLVSQQGALHVLDHHAEDHEARILELTGGRGVDVVLEMLANVNLARDLRMLARGGRVAVIGNRGSIEINPRELMVREAAVMGVLIWNKTPAQDAAAQAALQAGLASGALKPVIGHEFSLADAAQAHEKIMQDGALGKIVLLP